MKRIFTLLLFITIPMIAFSQEIDYSAFSVAATDNILSAKVNPASLGFGNATGLGFAQYFEEGEFEKVHSLFVNFRQFGYVFENVYDSLSLHTLALGFPLPFGNRNFYAGVDYFWENSNFGSGDFGLGVLLRPIDFLSLGLTGRNITKDDIAGKVGLAVRPIPMQKTAWDRVTISCDAEYVDEEWQKPLVGLDTEFIDGLQIGAKYDFEKEAFGIDFQINFSHLQLGTIFRSNDEEHGISYINLTQKYNRSFLSTRSRDRFYDYELEGKILEYPPSYKIGPFNIVSGKDKTIPEILHTIEELQQDETIKGIVFKSGNINATPAQFEELRDALLEFKAEGKKVVFYFEGISNMNYVFAAAIGDKIYLHPAGSVGLSGLSITMPYMKELLDTLGVEVLNFRSHEYKTGGNILSEGSMPEPEREMLSELLDGLYGEILEMISTGRGMSKEEVCKLIDQGPYLTAHDALGAGLVDSLIYEDELEEVLKKEFGRAKIVSSFKKNEMRYDWSNEPKPSIAVIYAIGNIHSGKGRPGESIGSETMAKAIRNAREDTSIKGIILRIDSGGGSALASETIWREIELCKRGVNAKPVVISMSGTAGSGGYYIACNADKIVAQPSTITGSVGVLGMMVNMERFYDKIHINWEIIKQGAHADFGSPLRPMTEDERTAFREAIDTSYWDFVDKVAQGRKMKKDAVHEIAQGRVWIGRQARELGLVDELGGMNKAIEIVKDLAGIPKDQKIQIVTYPEHESGITISFKSDWVTMSTAKNENLLPYDINYLLDTMEEIYLYQQENLLYLMPYKLQFE
jgi:protease-4